MTAVLVLVGVLAAVAIGVIAFVLWRLAQARWLP
jgi:hypothetical protein